MHIAGIPDDAFIRGKVPMTKQEIRMLTLGKARIKPDAVILDIGAGTGSLSIEAGLLAPLGHVYAVERNAEAVELIRKNAEKFRVENMTLLSGEAPAALESVPPCDVILIGGTGSHLLEILSRARAMLKPGGTIVINAITLQTLAATVESFKEAEDWCYEAIEVQINRWHTVGRYDMAQALNPIHIISCKRR